MSRLGSQPPTVVKPTNNIYTILVFAAVVAEILALVYLLTQSTLLQGKSVFAG